MSGDLTNCKNCGAPIARYSCKCEYCGTPYYEGIRDMVKIDEWDTSYVPNEEFLKRTSIKRRLERLERFYNIVLRRF